MKCAKLIEIRSGAEALMNAYYDSNRLDEKRVYTMAKLLKQEMDTLIKAELAKERAGRSAAQYIADFVDGNNTLPPT